MQFYSLNLFQLSLLQSFYLTLLSNGSNVHSSHTVGASVSQPYKTKENIHILIKTWCDSYSKTWQLSQNSLSRYICCRDIGVIISTTISLYLWA